MRSTVSTVPLVAATLAIQLATAQIVSAANGLPSCAVGCGILEQAQSVCVPSAGDAAQQKTCFCNSGYLQNPPLKSTADSEYCPSCTGSGAAALSQWYNSFCSSNAVVSAATSAATPAATTSPSPTTMSTSIVSAASSPGVSASAQGVDDSSATGSWWDTHYRWAIMVIVLGIAFAIIIGVGIWYKRRATRRRNGSSSAFASHPSAYAANEAANGSAISFGGTSHPDVDGDDDEKTGNIRASTVITAASMNAPAGYYTSASQKKSAVAKGRLKQLVGK